MANNRIIVIDNVVDLPTPSGGTHTLEPNTTYMFNQGTYTLSNTLTLGTNTVIVGNGKTASIVDYTGVSSLINATNCNFLIKDIELRSTTGSLYNVTNTSNLSVYVEDVTYRSFTSLGTIAGGGVFFRYTLALSCVNGITFSGALGSIIFDTASFRALSGGANSFAIKVLTGATATSFRTFNSIYEVSATHYGIWIEGTFTLTSFGVISSNVFYGAGTNRLVGVNGNTPNWTIMFGENSGIAGLQFVDVDISTTTDASFGNGAGTYIESATVRGYAYSLAEYDPYATVMEGKVMALVTSVEATFQIGVRNLTSATNLGGLKTAVLPATNGYVDSDYVAITPNRMYQAYYVKTSNTGGNVATRSGLKMKLKIY